jgi:O-antigen/teichoic acid export membrane protein
MKKIKDWLKRSSVHQGAFVLADQGMMSIGMFLAGVFLARATSKEEYAIYVLGWSFIAIVMGVHRAIVVLPYTVFSPRMESAEQDAYQSSGIAHTVAIGIIAVAGLALWAAWPQEAAEHARGRLVETLPLLSLITIPLLMREYLRSALFARLEFIDGAKVNTLASALQVVLIVVIYSNDGLNLESAYVVIAASTAVAVGALLRKHPYSLPTARRLWPDVRRNLKLGKWILINTFAFAVVSQVYVWLLLYLEDAAAVAAFGACLALSALLAPFLRAVNALVLPKMAHSGDLGSGASGLLRLLRVSVLWIAVPYLAWLLIGGLFADQLMTFFYSNKYAGYGTLLVLLIIKTTIDSVSTPLTSALQALERPDVTTVSLVMGAVVALTLGYILTSRMGLTGAGISACAAASVIAGWKWFALMQITTQRTK